MKIKTYLTALLVSTLCSFSTIAQEEYNPEFLIPYNDHGKWGFCDTLGNVKVEPQFEWVSFFFDEDGLTGSYVKKDGRRDYFVLGKGMCSPKDHESHPTLFHPFLIENNLTLVIKNEKIGLFDYERQKLVIPAEYDDYIFDTGNNAIYLSSRDQANKENMVVWSYDIKKGASERLNFSKVGIQPIRENDETKELILFRGKRGKWYQREGSNWVKSEYSLVNTKKNSFDDPRIKVAAIGATEKPVFEKVHRYSLLTFEDATLHSSIKLGDQRFQVMHKPSGFGLINEESEVLAFQYDFIDINFYDGLFYLLKDKKMGVHIPFTTYSTIEPKYDMISLYQLLTISDGWKFALFKVKVGTNEGYLGENGVEYFNFE